MLKLDFTMKSTVRPRRRFWSLTKVWSSKESLSVSITEEQESLLVKSQTAWVCILALPFTSCETLNKVLNASSTVK